jgi:hypothetical protein
MATSPINEQLSQLLTEAIQAGKNAVDFVQAQAPEIVQQLLHWKMAEAITQLTLSVIGLIIAGIAVRSCIDLSKKAIAAPYTEEFSYVIGTFACGLIAFFCLAFSLNNIREPLQTIIQITVAPKVYLMEYAAHLVGK